MTKNRLFLQRYGAVICAFALFGSSHAVSADWYVSGAQYSCSKKTETFTLLPYDRSSSDENPEVASGFTVLPDGLSNLACRLGKRRLQAQIGVTPPRSHGMCMGGGAVNINSLVVDGVELLDTDIPFNWSCTGSDEPLVKVQVRTKGSVVDLEQCTIKVTTEDNPEAQQKCSTKSFDVDAIAAANAKIDHQLADPRTQALKSATRLPIENDLAQVFASSYPTNSNVPLCAHWSAVFLNAAVAPERQRHGRIAGIDGERVYIHPANPQLCRNSDDDGCTARAYLLPGDRVNVGFICGAWVQIQYWSRVRSRPPIKGWVETARLYDVDPVPVGRLLPNPSLSKKQPLKTADPLMEAVVTKNTEEVKRLIVAGASPNGVNESGEPLAAAVETGDVGLVQTLLDLGANVNAQPQDNYRKCSILSLSLDNQQIFDELVKAGIDLNCRGELSGSTLLMGIAGYNRLWAWERIHDSQRASGERLRDPVILVKRLLAAGANPNVRDNFGRTALFFTMQANNVDVAQVLLDSGADPNISIDSTKEGASLAQQTGSTPLMEAFHWYPLAFDPTMFDMLLAHGANPNYRNVSRYDEEWDETTRGAVTFAGQTVLTRAAEDGYYTLARILLKHGADPTIPREDGALPEAIAVQKKHPKIAELIARHVKQRSIRQMSPASKPVQ